MTMAQLNALIVAENDLNDPQATTGSRAPERGTGADLMALASLGGR